MRKDLRRSVLSLRSSAKANRLKAK